VLESKNTNNIDILSAGYRKIKLDSVNISLPDENDTTEPNLTESSKEITNKTKAEFIGHNNEIRSISNNKLFTNNFISAEDFKVFLWDMNSTQQVNKTIIDLEKSSEFPEKITVAKYSSYNPNIFGYGTSKGVLKVCDLRTSSDSLEFSKSYFDENAGLNKTIFASSIMSVHDINFNIMNDLNVTTRHYLSLNYWDMRKTDAPTTKILLYEPIISKLSYLLENGYMSDKFSLSSDPTGKIMITGGYNNMFHFVDIDQ